MAKRPPAPPGVTENWIFTGTEQISLTADGQTLTIQRVSGSNKGTSSFSINQISGLQIDKPGFMQPLGRLRILVAGEVAPRRSQGMLEAARDPFVVQFNKKLLPNVEKFAASVRAAQAASRMPQAPVSPAAAPGPLDLAAQLGQLADLHSRGVLSDAEFSAAKARLLGTAADAVPASEAREDAPTDRSW